MTDSLTLMVFLIAIVLFSGAILAATPWFMKKNECFAVTIPESAQADVRFLAFRKRYAAAVLVVTLICSVALGVVSNVVLGKMSSATDAASLNAILAAAIVAAATIPLIASFALMLHYRKRVKAIKREEGWKAERDEAVALIGFEEAPAPPSLAWNVVYVPIVLITLALGLALYPSTPDLVPTHIDFAGNVNQWTPKGPALIAFPLLVEVFMAACFIFSHWMTIRSKKDVDPARPAISAYAYGAFARAECILLLVGGSMLTAVLGIVMILMMTEFLSMLVTMVLIIVATLVFVGATIAFSIVYGQSGSRLVKRLEENGDIIADNDEHWKAGIFYWNKGDASLILPKRFGVGWTMNWARPAAWVIVGGITLASIAFVAACVLLM
ncbi:DUF1648 domain-containing protein [uncultured Ellagibacter sp.]|uniref:DUF1648 domain-containing protein n=1 Tax=uncultured Ellagibacter sp. TaxID=2137580 RepID=UPI002626574F|nr:DUF1648 domain-containing protein [uncultured Ellagibacter sp.]